MKMTLKPAPGLTRLSLLMPCLLLGLLAGCATHPSTEAKLLRLQGSWEGVMVGGEKEGKITITITGNSLHFHGLNTNEVYDATFTLPAETNPHQLRATITNAVHPNMGGVVVRAIFKTGDGNLTLALNQDPEQEPPKRFGEGEPAVARYELWRVQPQKKNVETSTANETVQSQPTPGNAKSPEQGRKHPAELAKLVSGEGEIASPIAFQNNNAGIRKVYWLDKNGERMLYRELKPGESYELGTYLSHPWVVTDADGNALGLYFPDGRKRTVTLE